MFSSAERPDLVTMFSRKFPNSNIKMTYGNHSRVDTEVFSISTSDISKPAARGERGQEVAHPGPGRMASAAEMGSNGVVHSVHVFLFQMSCVVMASG